MKAIKWMKEFYNKYGLFFDDLDKEIFQANIVIGNAGALQQHKFKKLKNIRKSMFEKMFV